MLFLKAMLNFSVDESIHKIILVHSRLESILPSWS